MKTQLGSAISYLKISRKPTNQLEGRSCLVFSLSLVLHVKIVGLIKMCLTERCSGVWGRVSC